MKANLKLENIGSHRGVREYNINSGKITIFEGANSSGKSTIIKSIATILSSPINSNNLKKEANNFGILPMDNKESPIVNIFENDAIISLTYEDLNLKAILLKDGTINTLFPKSFQGNEIFLYACMLVKNSKIQRYLASGDDNFQWIVSEMSYASIFEELNETNNSYLRLNNAAKNTLKDVNNKIGKYISNIKDLQEKRRKLEEELEKVQEELNNLPPSENEELKELEIQQDKLSKEIRRSNQILKQKTEEAKEKKANFNNIEVNIENIKIEIEKLNNEIKTVTDEIEFIRNIDTSLEYSKIESNQKKINKLIEELTENKILRELHNVILNSRHDSDACPLCGSKIPTNKEKSSTKLKIIRKNIEELSVMKKGLENEIDQSYNLIKRAGSLKNYEDKLRTNRKKIDMKYKDIEKINRDTEELQNDLRGIEDNIKREEKMLVENETKLEEIEKQIEILIIEDKEKSEIYQKRKSLLNDLQKLDVNIEKNKELIKENSQIELYGIKIPIERADQIVNKLSDEFEKIELYLNEKILEQRTGAGKKFNSYIKKVMKELKLEDFEDIRIDLEDYRLVVVRKGGKIQPLGALGGAERGIIGGILQISCKQTYLKEIPFFIGDDIILELDPEMSKKFVDYLKNLAIENDLFVVITKISNNKQLKKIEL